MPVKIFAAPGDHRDDFHHVEDQVNAWLEEKDPKVISMHTAIEPIPDRSQYLLALIVHYE